MVPLVKPWIVALLVLAAAAAGFVTGRASSAPVEPVVPRAELTRVERERDDAVLRAQRADAALAQERRQRAAAGGVKPEPITGPLPGTEPPPGFENVKPPVPAPRTEAERQRDVHELVARIEPVFEKADGEGALELLRKLSDIVPEGRQAAMDLAVRINEDVFGAGALQLDQYTFYTSLGDTGVRDLMVWSLENPSPPAFRVLSAYSLPWVLPPGKKVDVLVAALGREKELQVQQAIVANLSQMNDSKAASALAGILRDTSRDGAMRAQIVTFLAVSANADLAGSIESAANGDPDDRVRAAARQALIARNPPVDGYLLSTVLDGGAAAAAGIRVGDILVSYDGKPTRELSDIRELTAATGPGETAPVVVLRESGEVTVNVRRGRMGIQGRAVKRK